MKWKHILSLKTYFVEVVHENGLQRSNLYGDHSIRNKMAIQSLFILKIIWGWSVVFPSSQKWLQRPHGCVLFWSSLRNVPHRSHNVFIFFIFFKITQNYILFSKVSRIIFLWNDNTPISLYFLWYKLTMLRGHLSHIDNE